LYFFLDFSARLSYFSLGVSCGVDITSSKGTTGSSFFSISRVSDSALACALVFSEFAVLSSSYASVSKIFVTPSPFSISFAIQLSAELSLLASIIA
jgi:hypothetical protein